VFRISQANVSWVAVLVNGGKDTLTDEDEEAIAQQTRHIMGDKAEKRAVYAGAGHFKLSNLFFSGGSKRSRLSFVKGCSPEPHPHMLSPQVLANLRDHVTGERPPRRRSDASLMKGGSHYCPCTDTTNPCTEFLNNNQNRVRPPKGVTSAWYRHIIEGSNAEARRGDAARETISVHANHFLKDDLTLRDVQFGKQQLTSKAGVVPRREGKLQPPPASPPQLSKKEKLMIRGKVRQHNLSANDASGSAAAVEEIAAEEIAVIVERHAKDATKIANEVAATAAAFAVGIAEAASANARAEAVIDRYGRSGKTIFELLEDADECFYYTNNESFEVLLAKWEYRDADGAFSTLTQRRSGRPEPEFENRGSTIASNGCALTAFGQFCFHEVAFKHFRGDGLLRHASNLFGISVRTGRRYYDTWTLAVGRFYDGQQHPATLSQAQEATAMTTRANLGLQDDEVVFLGDCTERWVDDPQDGALHSVLYSAYKSHTTIKYLTISTGDSYLSHVPRPFSGACTDNGAHNLAAIHKLFCVPSKPP
jgi:hypothetical protein